MGICPTLDLKLQLTASTMKVGLVGFAGSGKSLVFQWLTGVKPDPGKGQTGQSGNAKVSDARLDWLSAKFQPRKTTPAAIDFLDTPGLLPTERRDNPRRLGILREANGLVVVLNGFSESDLAAQLTRFHDEIVFADLEIITNRISRLDEQLKKPKPGKQKEADQLERALLQRIAAALEQGRSPAEGLSAEEEKTIRSFQLLTLKPEQVLVNIGDDRLQQPLPSDLLALAPTALQAAVKLEMELQDLADDDRQAFMQDLGLEKLSRDDILRRIFAAMGRIVFFTVGEDECRAWPIPIDADAVTGAGEVHTDLARGFVRAEVVSYADFQRTGSMKESKQQGVYRLEGKTYIVQDGDIMHILAST
jgi:ribosome-binding ATPase YchF (GTP1/OBG family)